ncbi:LacI family DNA-binding transcriptional regulator [Mesorhizobium sp. B1-1-8]|uniref:LacI family DNA-binding transcriptional regulator n=1 Tax=Mesorhizobium sp. B1-1-8 TaxID=2589976 RepID=UPI00112E341D|nr:LacI family DNA-binding transcriptional regulator [Mesorhizobium sp. B1-1-8]UCI07128.1 LacI family transcriptional regulator [Mesorhizobium sp. B1-1-8]
MPERKRDKPSRRVRLEDLARHCNVSISTASRALAGGKGVRSELRAQLLEAAKTLNYALPASIADRKVILAASSVAMVDYVRNQFTFYVLEGLNARAQSLGVEILTRPIASGAEEIRVLEEARDNDEVAGCLFLTLDDEEMLTLATSFGKPIVLVNGDDPSMRLSSVTPCNRSAARMATEYLIRLGHRRILFLMRRGRRTIERRFEGWQDAMRQHGIAGLEALAVHVEDWLPELGAEAIEQRIARFGLDFTAILTAGDSLAVGAAIGLERLGYKVPDDVSVMGMDDLPQAAFHNPPLTTMHIPMREIGAAALNLLLDDLGGFSMPPRRVELACRLVERRSTAKPPE